MTGQDSPMSISADRPEKVPSPRVHVRRLCDRIDRLLSLDHNPARKASEEYDDAFHDAVHAIRSLYRYTDLLPTSPAADLPVENSSTPMSEWECVCGHRMGDHAKGCKRCGCRTFAVSRPGQSDSGEPRPVENSELREALQNYRAAVIDADRCQGWDSEGESLSVEAGALQRIEEVFADLQRSALFWIAAHDLRMKDLDKDWAEISRLRADQITAEEAQQLTYRLDTDRWTATPLRDSIREKLRRISGSGSQ